MKIRKIKKAECKYLVAKGGKFRKQHFIFAQDRIPVRGIRHESARSEF